MKRATQYSLTSAKSSKPLNAVPLVGAPIKKHTFVLGDKAHVYSRASSGERHASDEGFRISRCVLNGYITYIHPDGNFINVCNGRYTESYLPKDIMPGWVTKSKQPDGTYNNVLPYCDMSEKAINQRNRAERALAK